MQSKNNAPTATQKRWREQVRDLGSIISGGPAVIHHPVGCSGRHRKIKIGHWWVIPITDVEHKDLHNGETFGFESRKEFEKTMFEKVCIELLDLEFDVEPSDIVFNAIADYHL